MQAEKSCEMGLALDSLPSQLAVGVLAWLTWLGRLGLLAWMLGWEGLDCLLVWRSRLRLRLLARIFSQCPQSPQLGRQSSDARTGGQG